MTSRRALTLVLSIGLVTLASSAGAASKSKVRRAKPTPPVGAVASCRGGNLFPCGPVYNSTDYLGNDPDPFIRLMIQRDLGMKYGGES